MGPENNTGVCKNKRTLISCREQLPEVVIEWKELKVRLSIPGTSLATEDILFTAFVCYRDAVKSSLTKTETPAKLRVPWHLNQHACFLESLENIVSKTKTDYVHTETDSRPSPNKPLKQKHHTSPGSQVIPACHVFEIPLKMLYAKTKTKNVKTKTT